MKKLLELKKETWQLLPYIYFIALVAFWILGDLFMLQKFSYIALCILACLIIQAKMQHKVIGTGIGIIAATGSLYGFLAVVSEFNDFEAVNNSALAMISAGSALTLSGLAMGVMLALANLKRLAV